MERLDHRLELGGRAARGPIRRIAPVGGEIGEGHIAPIIVLVILPRIPAGVAVGRRCAAMGGSVDVVLVVLHLLHGLQFDGGDAKALQVSGLLRRAGVSPALGLRDRIIVGGHAADVHLVDDVVLLRPGRLQAERVGRGRTDDSFGRDLLGVVIPVEFAGEDRWVGVGEAGANRVAGDLEGVGIQQELVGIEAIAGGIDHRYEAGSAARTPGGIINPVRPPGAITVIDGRYAGVGQGAHRDLRRPNAVAVRRDNVAGQDRVRAVGQGEQTKLDMRGVVGIDPETDRLAVFGYRGAELHFVDVRAGAPRQREARAGQH